MSVRVLVGAIVLVATLGVRAVSATDPEASVATPATPVSTAVAKPPGRAGEDFGTSQIRLINDQIAQAWKDHKLAPSEAATDGEWCRRVYLDLIGRVPTVDELKKYTSNKDHDK